ncbi:hypothetical protein ACP275_10G169500 [Erythranthe tilingii]
MRLSENFWVNYMVGFGIGTLLCHTLLDKPGDEITVKKSVAAAGNWIRQVPVKKRLTEAGNWICHNLFYELESNNPVPSTTATSHQNAVQRTPPPVLPVDDEELIMETREVSPTQFLTKIESFSLFFEYGIDKYETREFEAGDYKWRLVIYPYGKGKGNHHVSVYLALAETNSLPVDWEFNAIFTIFLYNQISDKYMCFRVKQERRFNETKSEWGFTKFIHRKSLRDKSSGYLVDDTLVLGAEVFVLKTQRQRVVERVTILEPPTYKHTHDWKITKFSKLKDVWASEEFPLRGYNWKMKLYPKGDFSSKDLTVRIGLVCVSADTFAAHQKIRAEFIMRLKGKPDAETHEFGNYSHWFTSSDTTSRTSAISLVGKDFLAGECCIVQVEISVQVIV